jgi:glycosyltransferase involved in cell wall biosynthesis
MLRILIDLGNASARTGTGIVALGLLDALNQFCSNEIEVSESGISSVSDSLRPLHRLVYLYRLSQLARNGFGGAQVAHFINAYVPTKHTKVAYVSNIHDIDAVQCPEIYSRRFVAYISRAYRTACDRSEVVVTTTEAVADMIRNEYDLPEAKVKVTGIGLYRRFVEAVDLHRARSEGHVAPSPRLLYVGQVSKKKNTAWLVNSFVRGVRSEAIPRMKLVLAGNAGYGAEIVKRELNEAGDLVQWHYNPPLDELARLYLECSAVILPSRREGFGIPLLEAMYCKKPIVASRIPTSLEVADSVAHFFSLDDQDEFFHATREAIENHEVESRHRAAEKQLEKYSWRVLAPQYAKVYAEAVKILHHVSRW